MGDEINMFIGVGVLNMYIFDDVEKRGRNLLREKLETELESKFSNKVCPLFVRNRVAER